LKGKIDVDNEMFVDLNFHGEKQNFDLLLAMAPNDIAQTLKTYDNKGSIFFDAKIFGKTINDKNPLIEARFGCKEGYILNPEVNKKVDELGFLCTFSNGKNHNASSSVFELSNFSAKPEAGIFKAKMKVVNFESPEIDMQIDSDFDLNFLTKFLKLYHLKNLEGKVLLSMKFHDIIDLKNPEKSLEKLNQAYFSKLKISDLNFKSENYPQKISNLNVEASIEGETLFVKNCNFNVNASDIQFKGQIKNIPALIHQNKQQIESDFHFQSKKLHINDFIVSKNQNQNLIIQQNHESATTKLHDQVQVHQQGRGGALRVRPPAAVRGDPGPVEQVPDVQCWSRPVGRRGLRSPPGHSGEGHQTTYHD
jgi:hypothetical protein